MLVLSRKVGERVVIDDAITLLVVEVSGNRIRLGIEAPPDVRIRRDEVPPERDTRHGRPGGPNDQRGGIRVA